MNSETAGTKLHLGCWQRHFPGWIHVDLCDMPHIDFKRPISDLSIFENESADLIYSSHSLTYFDRFEAVEVLKEWRRVLKPGGLLRLAVPNFIALIEVYQRTNDLSRILGPLYGRMKIQTPEGEKVIYHKTTYDLNSLTALLNECGFKNVVPYRWQDTPPHDKVDDHSQAYFPHMDKENGLLVSLNVEAMRA